jgi:tRNA G37 N-methylase Trm5
VVAIVERRLFGFYFPCDVSKRGPPRLIFAEGERFIAERKIMTRLLKPGFRVVDVGANIGYYCLIFCRAIGPTGRVFAIEPSPGNLPQLELAIRRNGLVGRVEVISSAVGDKTGVVGFNSGTNGLHTACALISLIT